MSFETPASKFLVEVLFTDRDCSQLEAAGSLDCASLFEEPQYLYENSADRVLEGVRRKPSCASRKR